MSKIKVSEAIASLLASHGIKHVFGIIGSANAHLFDAVYSHPELQLVCLHHEQACVMAAHGYYMQSGNMAAVLVTAGAGTTNALTGVVGAWADSVPVLIITGQESTKQFKGNNLSRMIGVQGVYAETIYSTCTKSVVTCQEPEQAIRETVYAIRIANADRRGPCIVDIPIDLQAIKLPRSVIEAQITNTAYSASNAIPSLPPKAIDKIVEALRQAEAPLLWLGNGLRRMNRNNLREILLNLSVPYLTSWTATDLVDPIDELYVGHAGTYGSRAGNIVLQSCDVLLTLGTRLAIPQKGYIDEEFARRAEVFVIDCDQKELDKLGQRFQNKFIADAETALLDVDAKVAQSGLAKNDKWLNHIKEAKQVLPLVEDIHCNGSWINSYAFMAELGRSASCDTSYITDMGTALLSGFQILEPRSGQRLFTSQGLGEMGYGLPGAIGAWFADPSRKFICLNCDGGLMMNLQELHSVVSHGIPLKIVIFNNDGYLMIKHTQDAIVAGRRAGTDKSSGLSCPDYEHLVRAFGLNYIALREAENTSLAIKDFLDHKSATVLEVFMSPTQLLVPKLSVSLTSDGALVSPPLEDLSPLIPLEKLKNLLLVPIHENSLALDRGVKDSKGDAIY